MTVSKITVRNPLGLHARPAAKLVDCASRFSSEIKLNYQDKNIDAKSIMSVLMLAAAMGAELELHISGEDEEAARAALEQLFESGFGELE
jgi:phosphocarrier protein